MKILVSKFQYSYIDFRIFRCIFLELIQVILSTYTWFGLIVNDLFNNTFFWNFKCHFKQLLQTLYHLKIKAFLNVLFTVLSDKIKKKW